MRFPTRKHQCLQVHPSLTSVCHLVYSAAEVKFGILAAQNAVGTLLVSRVITPSILRPLERPARVITGCAQKKQSEFRRCLPLPAEVPRTPLDRSHEYQPGRFKA